ncbi:hypothetical protein T261_00802 [Streptomyces lydicus]|nr:hypothetical protein T261_00802 [Streptomyces lydicus]
MTATPLLLVDGHHLLHRAWYGFAARIYNRDKSIDRTGIFGFAALLRKAQTQHADGFELFVVFDAEDGSTGRAAEDTAYKAQRPGPEPGLIESLALVKDALDHSNVRWIEQDGCEADDVIATLTRQARADGRPVDIMSGDKDFIQLLDDPTVRLLNPALRIDRRYTTAADIHPRYGVTPHQWADYRALTGDPSDNIAGVKGIGPKTAARLLSGRRGLESVPIEDLRPYWADHWGQARRWREMIKLDRKVDLPDDLLTTAPTPGLPRAALVLEALGLW